MLVGREHELNVLNSSFRLMLEGKGSILFLTGEAGLGKTTLIHEWWKTIAPDSAIYAEAACSIPVGNVDVGRLEALQPWADVVAQLQGHEEQGKKKLDLKKLIFDSAPAWAWALPIVGGIAHGAMETARLVKEQQSDHNPNASNQQQVFQQYVNLLTKIADETPLVILLDDMHWADTSSTNLLFYLSRQINEKKILVLVTYRPDDAISANDGKGHPIVQVKNEILRYGGKEYSLSYLGDNAIRELLGVVFPAYEVNDKFERWLRKISDGNSLFVTQFIKTLHEDGHLDERGTFSGDYENIKTPDSALAVVTERTRRLDTETRELLTYATAEGEEFTSYVLEQLTKKDTMQLLKELQIATQLGVIAEKGYGRMYANQTTGVFGFSHALFHKALYDSLLATQKNYLHRKCYEMLKAEWDRLSETNDRTNSLASKLLTHAEKCGEYETAAKVALEAARGAWQTYAEAEAQEMLSHVLRLAESNTSIPATLRIDALLLQADIHRLHNRYDESFVAAANALELSNTLHDDARGAKAMNNIGLVHLYRGAYDEGLEYHAKSLAIRESIGDRTGIAVSLGNIGNAQYIRGAYDEALEYYAKALAIFESINDRTGIALSLNNIGNVQHIRDANDEALEYYIKALAIFESIGDRKGIAIALTNIGGVHETRWEYDEALEYHTKSLAIKESIGDRNGIALLLGNIGMVYRKQGNLQEARALLVKAKNIADELHIKERIADGLCELGLLCEAESMQSAVDERSEKLSEAASLLEAGLAIFRDMKSVKVKEYEPELARLRESEKLKTKN
jgi:predicted ATPase